MQGAGAWPRAATVGYLLLAVLILQSSTGVKGDRSESEDDNITYGDYDTDDGTTEKLNELNKTIVECCNRTREEVLSNVKNLSSIIRSKMEGLANKEDVTSLQNDLDQLATKSALTDIQGKLEELPSLDTIRNYTEFINDKFTTLATKMEANITGHISNGTYKLNLDLEDIKEQIKRDAEQLLRKLNTLSTSENVKKLNEILSSTKESILTGIEDVQQTVYGINQNMSKLADKNDIGNITNLVTSLATKESLETFEDKLNSLSKEASVKNLTDFVSSEIADKTDIDQTKEKITTSTAEIKKELSALNDKLSGLAANADLQSLNTKVIEIDVKFNKSRETVSELKKMLQDLQKKQEDQNNILKKLADNVGKPSSAQDLENVESLIKSLQTTSTTTLQAVKDLANIGPSTTNCLDSSEFSKKIFGLRKKVENKCSYDGIQSNLKVMEERIQNRLDNITFCDKEEVSPITTIPEAGTCEDSVFINPPDGLNVCMAVVTKRLCNTDPLIGFHCCQSCVFANQISSYGKHLYMKAPREIYYSDVLDFVLSGKNYYG